MSPKLISICVLFAHGINSSIGDSEKWHDMNHKGTQANISKGLLSITLLKATLVGSAEIGIKPLQIARYLDTGNRPFCRIPFISSYIQTSRYNDVNVEALLSSQNQRCGYEPTCGILTWQWCTTRHFICCIHAKYEANLAKTGAMDETRPVTNRQKDKWASRRTKREKFLMIIARLPLIGTQFEYYQLDRHCLPWKPNLAFSLLINY